MKLWVSWLDTAYHFSAFSTVASHKIDTAKASGSPEAETNKKWISLLARIDRPVTPVTPGFRVVFLSFSRSHALHGCVHRQLCQCIRRLKGTIKPRTNPTKHELNKCVGRRSLVIKGLASLGLGQSTSISALLVLRSRFCRTPLLLRLRLLWLVYCHGSCLPIICPCNAL